MSDFWLDSGVAWEWPQRGRTGVGAGRCASVLRGTPSAGRRAKLWYGFRVPPRCFTKGHLRARSCASR